MSGREKIVLWQYNADGSYVRKWNCISDLRKEYYNGEKYPLFRSKKEEVVSKLPDGTYVCKSRAGRNAIKYQVARINSKLIFNGSKGESSPIEMLNLDGEVVAEFKNIYAASIILEVTTTYIIRIIESSSSIPKNKWGVYMRFKTD